jgi:hypothetical protein
MIHKPSAIILGLLCSGGHSNRPMFESASFKNWRSGITSILTFRPQKSRNQVRNQNSDRNFAGICNLAADPPPPPQSSKCTPRTKEECCAAKKRPPLDVAQPSTSTLHPCSAAARQAKAHLYPRFSGQPSTSPLAALANMFKSTQTP